MNFAAAAAAVAASGNRERALLWSGTASEGILYPEKSY